MRPGDDLAVVGLGAERQRGLPGGLRGLPVAGVVFDAPDQQRDPACLDEDLPVLLEGDPLSLKSGDPAQPRPALDQELVGGQERVFRTQPVGHDPQPVQRGLIQVGTLQPADQLQRVHARHGQDLGLGVSLWSDREHRVRHGAEHRRDDRLVERLGLSAVRLDLAGLPALPLPQQALIAGEFAGACARIARTASAWLQLRALRSLVIRRAHVGRSSAIAATPLRSRSSSTPVSPMTRR